MTLPNHFGRNSLDDILIFYYYPRIIQTIAPGKSEQLRQKIALNSKVIYHNNKEQAIEMFVNIIADIETDYEVFMGTKASIHDTVLIVQEITAGFSLMDKHFEAVNKRFAFLQ